jgi:hypothetical protein
MAQNSWKLLITHVHIEASTRLAAAKVTEVMGGMGQSIWFLLLALVLVCLRIDSAPVSK